MSFAKSASVKQVAPLAEAMAVRDPNTNLFHSLKGTHQAAAANTSVSKANAANTLTLAAGGSGVSHVIGGIFLSLAGGTVGTLAAGVGTLTSNNTTPTDGDTVTIDTKVYTFKTTLTGVEGQVLINGSADAALLNLIRAINHSGTPNTDYVAAAAHPTVFAATSVTSHAFAITSFIPGSQANAIATTTVNAGSTLSWGAATLASGAGAMLQVKDGTTIVFNASLSAAGQQQFTFNPPLKGSANSAMVVTVGAAGSAVFSSIQLTSHWTEK